MAPVFPEETLPTELHLFNFLHHLNSLDVEVSVVLEWLITFLLELKNCVLAHVLTNGLTVCLGPSHLPWVVLGLELFVTF